MQRETVSFGRRAAVLILAASAALAPSAIAGTGQTQYPTTFTKFEYEVSGGDAEFKGKIDSEKGGCVKDRKVKLYRKRNGDEKKLGGDDTNDKGKFSIDVGTPPAKNGKYYAEVKEATIGEEGNEKTCLARTSPTIKLS
jgi:hypothetical protein